MMEIFELLSIVTLGLFILFLVIVIIALAFDPTQEDGTQLDPTTVKVGLWFLFSSLVCAGSLFIVLAA